MLLQAGSCQGARPERSPDCSSVTRLIPTLRKNSHSVAKHPFIAQLTTSKPSLIIAHRSQNLIHASWPNNDRDPKPRYTDRLPNIEARRNNGNNALFPDALSNVQTTPSERSRLSSILDLPDDMETWVCGSYPRRSDNGAWILISSLLPTISSPFFKGALRSVTNISRTLF